MRLILRSIRICHSAVLFVFVAELAQKAGYNDLLCAFVAIGLAWAMVFTTLEEER